MVFSRVGFVTLTALAVVGLGLLPTWVHAQAAAAECPDLVARLPERYQERWKPNAAAATLDQRVQNKEVAGIAVALVTPERVCVITRGSSGNARPLDEGNIFQIGSVTKVLVGALVAQSVLEGRIRLDDPIGKVLGTVDESLLGNPALAQVTWRQLLTHRSGLPRIPSTDPAFLSQSILNRGNPYANFSRADWINYLRKVSLKAGDEPVYSNSGFALLGLLISTLRGKPLDALMRESLGTPLQWAQTALSLDDQQMRARATPHDDALRPVEFWQMREFDGAGGVYSTATDLAKILQASMRLQQPWAETLRALDRPSALPGGGAQRVHGYAWVMNMPAPGVADTTGLPPQPTLIWHNGLVGGSASFVAFDPRSKLGVVVLTNTHAPKAVSEVARHFLVLPPPSK